MASEDLFGDQPVAAAKKASSKAAKKAEKTEKT